MVQSDLREQLQSTLGANYTLERELGRGGMATVYLARDARHKRRVAVKVLHAELSAALGPERFLREIELTAALQHPHILPLFDSGSAEGRLYYVMPYVEGESLRERLVRERQLPVDDAVRIAGDVAAALDYAHRRGIVHRDVKPENVLLHDGRALVADFGIARAVARAADADTLTGTGVSVGTPQYMSPEQVAGEKELDARSDVFALGCVVYEMLAGAPPFTAPTAQGIVARVMAEAPRPLAAERRAVPPHVATAVHRALEKLPADRFATAADFSAALTAPGISAPTGPSASSAWRSMSAARLLPWAVSVALALALALVLLSRRAAPPERPTVTALTAPEGQEFVRGPHFALSPDGSRLVFAALGADGGRLLWLRRLDGRDAEPLVGTDGAAWPFWSPDGRQLGFFSAGRLRTIDAEGGPTRDLCPAPAPLGGSWGTRGVILYAPLAGSGIHRVRADGGPCTPVTRVRPADRTHKRPDFLPDGRHFLFHSLESRTLFVGDAETGAYDTLLQSGVTNALFVPPNIVIYANPLPPLWVAAQRLDMRTLRLVGEPTRIVDGIFMSNADLGASASRDGTLVLAHVGGWRSKRLVWVDRRGAVLDSLPHRYFGAFFALSRDGRRIAFGSRGVWIHDLERDVAVRVDADSTAGRPDTSVGRPAWGPGDSLIAYNVLGPGGQSVRVHRIPTGTSETLFSLSDRPISFVDWSPDGRSLSFVRQPGGGATRSAIWVYSLAERRARPLLESPSANYGDARFAPDGSWIAYTSDETGATEVWLRPVGRDGGAVRVSTGGGSQPVWRADGRELFFATTDRRIAVVPVRLGARAEVGAPRIVVASPPDRLGFTMFQVTPEGERIILFQLRVPSELTVMQGWQARLARSAGAR